MKAAVVPLPLDLLGEIARVSGFDIDEIMTSHPGRKIWKRYSSYPVSARVFDRAFVDLLAAVACFEEAVGQNIFDRVNEARLEDIKGNVQKELFAATSAARSLVDHSRRLQKEAKFDFRTRGLKVICQISQNVDFRIAFHEKLLFFTFFQISAD
ncbi:hypothetical protein QA648_33145 (plasmid) [Rhizobium sp. CB3171]|uniref:hypothetical protein n=1 Tax=Rhizobium sp. CB3171 TaxID=3039157 RepID=UPI0024B1460F|nr:hypothetical protein [Rhizobium sp. CB3171]WFU07048.1 hypothetical protein QA648_33145 [Rhizobium sp. CB3171]